MTLTDAEDRSLRTAAKRLGGDLGEDAYHDAVVALLSATSPKVAQIVSPQALLFHGTKWALHRLWREQEIDSRCITAYLAGDPSPQQANLFQGRVRRDWCKKKLHALTDDNTYWSKGQRWCRACRRARNVLDNRARRARNQRAPSA